VSEGKWPCVDWHVRWRLVKTNSIIQCLNSMSVIYCWYFLLNSTLSFLQYTICPFYTYLPCRLMVTNKLWSELNVSFQKTEIYLRTEQDKVQIHAFKYSISSPSDDRSIASLKRAVHIMRSRASSFKWEYRLLSLRSAKSLLRFLPRLPVTSSPPFILPSITRYIRQFLRKMWPIQLAFLLLISCRTLFAPLL